MSKNSMHKKPKRMVPRIEPSMLDQMEAMVASFHRQIISLGCCLDDPDLCPMLGHGQDPNQHIG